MAGRNFWVITGGALAAGAGYYLYNAGGSPSAAEKRLEADATKLGRELGLTKTTETKKVAEVSVADAGKKIDEMTRDAKSSINSVDKKLESYRTQAEKTIDSTLKEARDSANKAADKFDKATLEATDKAKSGISSWFGGSK
ncbi:hypothetical protein BAUCODRAFT_126512 [Baudoinia panamericana UAMH 10762]|uniref:Calcofluor white hypersensitive protein n=1 Tax=Baudoinia panamericana (strain UAMH 10762) TaxID=717646 RepID=M2N0W6_BAUPA|nr:uncharacterized protein BAUCODRAFT_126512 [Baudoinia panamericana UAMH 10762]EMC92544.1 hypothetical protein BAUCODRAFT_126512 [Baudoinia panamericana UAMH 10762]